MGEKFEALVSSVHLLHSWAVDVRFATPLRKLELDCLYGVRKYPYLIFIMIKVLLRPLAVSIEAFLLARVLLGPLPAYKR